MNYYLFLCVLHTAQPLFTLEIWTHGIFHFSSLAPLFIYSVKLMLLLIAFEYSLLIKRAQIELNRRPLLNAFLLMTKILF